MQTNHFGAAPASSGLRLDQLPDNQWATVLDVARPEGADDRELVLRLTEIGFVPGEAVRIVARGLPGREPLAVRLGHTTFALRRHEAALIHVAPGLAEGASHG
ncbi:MULTISPECIES: FeoA family protein [Variovorax]|uniref:Ferrous iron transport protein A n=2 Tax=Variovorax TaxID=34072 RepID=A0AAE4BW94_VARPD|nr:MULTISPECIES: FeoA family protein [Variovorax]MBD9667476.1 ferrous iron transport protein A [Variovorax sp. VRV01]MBW8717009.1 ferrous iron transport protein A [Variovorax paradoxus]MDP9962416.1 ferrous iron transport protein A [Variovorax paradoxus]MDP9974007.1 ferrous iron transport protein A [Variovorax paradoxus]MDR6424667.1 ferrous iron transport protein A [Variovorax paradoxus]